MAAAASAGRASAVERVAPEPALDAARALYERHEGRVFRFCLGRLGSREEAEDARQTTFLYAFRALRRGVVPVAEASWLIKIAENVCRSRRDESRRRFAFEVAEDPQTFQGVAAPGRREIETLMPLEEALGRLTQPQRRALLLREWRGLSYSEIAEELGMGQGAVEALLFRARRGLAEELEAPGLKQRRGVRCLDIGWLASSVKSLFGGGALAIKAAATALVVTAAASTLAVVIPDEDAPPARPAGLNPPAHQAERPEVSSPAARTGAASSRDGRAPAARSGSAERTPERPSGAPETPPSATPGAPAETPPAPAPGPESAARVPAKLVPEQVETAVGSVTAPVEKTREPVVGTASSAAEPVVETVSEAAEPVVETVSEAAEPVVETVSEAAEPVVETGSAAAEPVVGTVPTSADKFVETATTAATDALPPEPPLP